MRASTNGSVNIGVDREISVGDYVLTNGALPATVLIDAVARQVSGVLGDEESLEDKSSTVICWLIPVHRDPADYRGMKVPEVLLSGNHQQISKWREEQRRTKTEALRPDLLNLKQN